MERWCEIFADKAGHLIFEYHSPFAVVREVGIYSRGKLEFDNPKIPKWAQERLASILAVV